MITQEEFDQVKKERDMFEAWVMHYLSSNSLCNSWKRKFPELEPWWKSKKEEALKRKTREEISVEVDKIMGLGLTVSREQAESIVLVANPKLAAKVKLKQNWDDDEDEDEDEYDC